MAEPDSPVEGTAADDTVARAPLTKAEFEALARYRFGIRQYLRFSEETVRSHGVTPQHYQVLLALKGFPGREWATVGELAEKLQLRHHSVVELVNRVQKQGLVQRAAHPTDWRAVRVELRPEGHRVLERLSPLHREQLRRMRGPLTVPRWDEGQQ
jgi:DNA-binding MarR family transcriptional regulator